MVRTHQRECLRHDCTDTFFTRLGRDYHYLRTHEDEGILDKDPADATAGEPA